MLAMDPSKRPSAQEILDDPWIKEKAKTDNLNTDIMTNLSKFHVFKLNIQNENQMRAAIL